MKNRNAFRGGAYALAISTVVLAILIVVNIFASSLPSSATRYDISASKLYSITSNTKVVVNALEQDVTIYWIVQSGEENEVVENLLSKYDSLSARVTVVKKNPDVYPTFAGQYTDEAVQNNSLIVECGERSRFISYGDIFVQEPDIYSYSYNTSFDGEGAITSAIDYVTTEELPQIYILEGHGEADLPASFQEQIEKENMEVKPLSLLTVDDIPEDADCVMIYAPSSDISQEEKELLEHYAAEGGKLFVAAGPVQDGILENLYSLLADYGVRANEGVVVEPDREHYSFQGPLSLLPAMNSHAITDSLMEENYYPTMPVSLGLTVPEDSEGVVVLLTTSDTAFSKLEGYAMTDYEKEEGDIDGPFALAVSIDTAGAGRIVWFTSSHFLNDMHNAVSSGANANLGMLEQFEALGAAFIIEDVEDFGQYGLDNPVCTVSLTTADRSFEIRLGDYSKMDSQRYISIGDGNVYLVKHDPLDEFSAKLSAVIDHDQIPAFGQVTRIQFSGSEHYTVTYQEESPDTYCGEDVYFTQINGKTAPLDTELVKGYLRRISNLTLTDYVSYNATDEELRTYGLDQPELTVTVEYTPDEENSRETSFILHISRDPATEPGNDSEDEEYSAYVRVGESRILYQISSDRYETLMDASYNTLRHQELLTADFADIRQIDVSLEGSQYTFTPKSKGNEISWFYQNEELETIDFPDALAALTAEEFTSERPAQKEEIRLTVLLENARFPEVEIALYRYDGACCLAELDGESIALVARESVVDLIEAIRSIVL
ncbi:DUF4340 domain-containing protein [uncultured Oscillibacter sp.]|uniref:DUF4340 domain-containing protein n=1 Tax=uncultured Oscillibacter sp. TaxID=876091 RepID=UPI0025D92236|nr:DUF4340 domain-containing protein [uncultured Oscillibacter sp.]